MQDRHFQAGQRRVWKETIIVRATSFLPALTSGRICYMYPFGPCNLQPHAVAPLETLKP